MGELADDGRHITQAVGAHHEGLEVLQLTNLLGQGVESVAEEVEGLGVGVGFNLLHQVLGAPVHDANLLLALGLGVGSRQQQGGKEEDG